MKTSASVILWATLTVAASAALVAAMFSESEARQVFLPGKTTAGHYQIELACGECHSDSFAGPGELQSACEKCHSEELSRANDSHPKSKFTDPRNAARVEVLDARYCVTCHQEHNPATTGPLGVTLPEDYCYRCHQDVAEERPSHEGMPFDSCDDAGCHNFHDNRALYEDYLHTHLETPDQLSQQAVASLTHGAASGEARATVAGLPQLDAEERAAFERSAHGRSDVSCGACHASSDDGGKTADLAQRCGACHRRQTDGWLAGRHGMRVAAGLPPMKVSDARAEMKPEAGHLTLNCDSCHAAHGTDTRHAATAACKGCHADEHTRAYDASVHAELWRKEVSGQAPAGSGVSCATCHMPRVQDEGVVFVEHNQNDNLRPREKMVRRVCDRCHGPGFALAALSDEALVSSNFAGSPRGPHESMQLVRARSNDSK